MRSPAQLTPMFISSPSHIQRGADVSMSIGGIGNAINSRLIVHGSKSFVFFWFLFGCAIKQLLYLFTTQSGTHLQVEPNCFQDFSVQGTEVSLGALCKRLMHIVRDTKIGCFHSLILALKWYYCQTVKGGAL